VLSPLQERIAGLSEAEDFALAGGAALIVRGDIDRKTRDLDFFGLSAAAVDHLVPLAEQALREAGLQVKRVQEGPGFARFVIEDEDDRTVAGSGQRRPALSSGSRSRLSDPVCRRAGR